MAFWTCPGCNRKVPGYAVTCHCGTARTTAHNVPAPTLPSFGPTPFSTRDFTWQIWVALGVILLAMGLGVWQLMRTSQSPRLPALLGIIDPVRPKPTPRPKATPRPRPETGPSPATSPA